MSQDIRWKERFSNFGRAFALLRDALENGVDALSPLEQEGVVQRFEYSFELAWKTMKDYLEENGVVITPLTPRQVIKEAFSAKILDDGQVWVDMLDHRDLLSHTYDQEVFSRTVRTVCGRYLPALDKLHGFFAGQEPL